MSENWLQYSTTFWPVQTYYLRTDYTVSTLRPVQTCNLRTDYSAVQQTGSNILPENWLQYSTTDGFKHLPENWLQYSKTLWPVRAYYLRTVYSTVKQTGSNFEHITWELTTVQHSDRFKLSRLLKSNVDLKRRLLSVS